jgi:tripartite-type tricarboxylate transporter receptor subunit TctC
MEIPRRQFLQLAASVGALPTLSESTQAQSFPARPVTLIVPYPAGTATDTTLRSLASATQRYLGRSIVIENRPGGGGITAPAQMAAMAKPDGYTISQIPLPVFRAPFLGKTTYDPKTDFTYIIGVTGYAYGVVVRNSSRWKTFLDLLADAKANPGKITFGTPGANTTQHVTMSVIAKRQGISWVHVPFRGTPEMTSALLGGHLDVSADTTAWGPQVRSGELRVLVTFGAERLKKWPDAPTLRDLGIDFVANSPYGLAGPRGMDAGVVMRLHDAFKQGMEERSFRATLDLLDQEFLYMSSEDYTRFAAEQIAEQQLLVDELGLKQE